MNYIQKFLNKSLKDCKLISIIMMPTNFYTITLEGWMHFAISHDDPTWNNMMKIAALNVEMLVSIYGETHAFTEPSLSYSPSDSTLKIRIGTMELERYDEIMEKMKV
jgi:hypothetical protein